MNETLITFETAKLAKEKGFKLDYPTECYNKDGSICMHYNAFSERITGKPRPQILYIAPTQSLLQKWIRDEHMIRVFPHQGVSGNFKVDIFTYPIPNKIGKWERFNNIQSYNTYEEALEAGLYQTLLLL